MAEASMIATLPYSSRAPSQLIVQSNRTVKSLNNQTLQWKGSTEGWHSTSRFNKAHNG